MKRQVVLITGHTCNGKSYLARALRDEFGFHLVRTSEILTRVSKARALPTDRLSLQILGDLLDQETSDRWVYDEVCLECDGMDSSQPVAVDNIRTAAQLDVFRSDPTLQVIHVHLYARPEELEERFKKKLPEPGETATTYPDADLIKEEGDVQKFKADADVRIFTSRTDGRDTLVRVAARLGLYSPPNERCVDVVVGGQYGSEGKGHVAGYLSSEYDVLLRVGGPNAGHTVSSDSGVFTYHQLPSGARDTEAKLLLGPGMTIYVPDLLKEIEECGISEERLFIDPQAMIITEEDKENEKRLVEEIASTGKGGGAAAARRILERNASTKLARDIPELSSYVGLKAPYRGATRSNLEDAYSKRMSILLEGTQGTGLSIFHGAYPYVTSRDTTVAGCLAEAGISPSRVRRILMVIRPTPIRVGDPDKGGTSGPLKHPVEFREIANEAGLDPDDVTRLERTSTTDRPRRVGWFEWDSFRDACSLNAPTDIVLTFADYLSATNRNARRFEQLDSDTIKFVEELERVAQAPVSLINTRFPREGERIDIRSIIDRRSWVTGKRRQRATG